MPLTINENMTTGEQAALWVVQLTSDDVSANDHVDFENWLAQNQEHQQQYTQAHALWASMENAQELIDNTFDSAHANIIQIAEQPKVVIENNKVANKKVDSKSLRVYAVAASIVMMAALGILFFQNLSPIPIDTTVSYATKIAEVRDIVLPDSTVVTLGARSTIITDFSQDLRQVTLTTGEAFFAVSENPKRPFIVLADNTHVRVVGTKFGVRYGVQEVKVAVQEGIVDVKAIKLSKDAKAQTNRLTAGEEIISLANGTTITHKRSQQRIATWRKGRLVYADESLREVIADANRYHDGNITLATQKIGDLRVTASFRTDQIDQMIRSLAVALELDVINLSSRRVVLHRRYSDEG